MTPLFSMVWGSPHWMTAAAVSMSAAAIALLWSYLRARARPGARVVAAALKAAGFAALALCLVDPLLTGTRPRRGANAFVVLADNSQSMLIHDGDQGRSRGEWLRARLAGDAAWMVRLEQDFKVRRYRFDAQMHAVDDFSALDFRGVGSSLAGALNAVARRFRGVPIAGVLVFTDGCRTDSGEDGAGLKLDAAGLPPVYPVAPPSRGGLKDVGIENVAVSQSHFEAAPASVNASVATIGLEGRPIVAAIVDEHGKEISRQEAEAPEDGRPLAFHFQFRPERSGVNFYRVEAFPASEGPSLRAGPTAEAKSTMEQTLANNDRWIVVDRGGGPFRVLYVGGRPNWEFKFLRRALEDDDQLQLVGLVRIARRQPRFDFRDMSRRDASRLFEGFEHPDDDAAERADEPVLVRLNVRDEAELRDGFPKSADELYRYHAVVLDDIEASFFNADQQALLRNFVSQRGGGLLMLGGPDTFAAGGYGRTPIGDLLPVYLGRTPAAAAPGAETEQRLEAERRWALTREGWLQPWARLRKTEGEEQRRLAEMPGFRVLSPARGTKPGAMVLAEARDRAGNAAPALVAQPFGKGRVGALLVGDLWRWGIRRADPANDDFERGWRQVARWLVADVPTRVELSTRPKPGAAATLMEIHVLVRGPEFRPLDNARVALTIVPPDGKPLAIDAEADPRAAGRYTASYAARQTGAYRVTARATGPDGAEIGTSEAGWAAQPAAAEFARLQPDRDLLKTIAEKTGGEIVNGDRLDGFVASLATRGAPITEPWASPLWHRPWYFLLAIGCLIGEWAVRRTHGLA